jgi:hypothetical protein
MSRQYLGIAATVVTALIAVGCDSGSGRVRGTGSAPDDSPTPAKVALLRTPSRPGEVIVHGDASPGEHGPFVLHGRYVARFQQYAPEDPHMSFRDQTPFVAALVRGRDTRRRLFRSADATGRTTLDASGSWRIEVSFGDFPYVIRLTPKPSH